MKSGVGGPSKSVAVSGQRSDEVGGLGLGLGLGSGRGKAETEGQPRTPIQPRQPKIKKLRANPQTETRKCQVDPLEGFRVHFVRLS